MPFLDQILSLIVNIYLGKPVPIYTPHIAMGDKIIVQEKRIIIRESNNFFPLN